MNLAVKIHARALEVAKKFKNSQTDLVEILQELDRHKVHIAFGYSSLFAYVTGALKLSEDIATAYILVARKAQQIPAMMMAIRKQEISLSKARRICSVITAKNQEHWLGLAATLSKRELEKMVATENPAAAVFETATYVSGDRIRLQLGLSEKTMMRLRRAQDVLSQKRRRALSLEETIEFVVDEFLRRHDPIKRASRQEVRGKLMELKEGLPGPGQVNSRVGVASEENFSAAENQRPTDSSTSRTRELIPAAIKHKVYLKFGGQCGHTHPNGSRCSQRRFLDIHHRKPVSEGGGNELENLELLCFGHHRARHLN